MKDTCTRCSHGKLRLPIGEKFKSGYIVCPFRKGENYGFPVTDAFPEFSEVCEHFKDLDDKSLNTSTFNSGHLVDAMCGGSRIPQRGQL